MTWDPNQYLKFADHRARPFHDLLARVEHPAPRRIVDLGCGPGHLTRLLAARWPMTPVLGLDSSPEMLLLARAEAMNAPGQLAFVRADVATWTSDEPVDLLFANAVLHWIGDHDALLPRLVGQLAPGGVLAVQLPYHASSLAHQHLFALTRSDRWRDQLAGVGLGTESVRASIWYVERLRELGLTVDAWETTYYHTLTGEQPVLEWMKGSALRPLLARLNDAEKVEFLRELGERYRAAYPPHRGETLFPFPRLFLVATVLPPSPPALGGRGDGGEGSKSNRPDQRAGL